MNKELINKWLKVANEFNSAKKKHIWDMFSHSTPRIKLFAIAKNEAAYLPEWLAHHLYFGFDHIEVHINRTTDNTVDVLHQWSQHPKVSLPNADAFFDSYPGNPQSGLYKAAFKDAREEGFTHICFLDIDEFWVPRDLNSNIHTCLSEVGICDVISFEWANKYEPDNLFGPAIAKSIQVKRLPQVKSIIDVNVPYHKLNPHTVVNPFLRYRDATGKIFPHANEAFSRTTDVELLKPVKPYFILHRYYRSEIEYMATLGRGRPKFKDEGVTTIKGNRSGFSDGNQLEKLEFDSKALEQYQAYMAATHHKMIDEDQMVNARQSVYTTYEKVLRIIKNAKKDDAALLTRSLKNITDEASIEALENFFNRTTT